RGQAAIQITYHPDRIAQPMKRDGARGSGQFKPIGWDEAIAELVSKLDGLEDRKTLAMLVRPRRGRRNELFAEFARRYGAPSPVAYELFSDEVLRRANGINFGRAQLPTFDLARSRYVIGFGADFLGTWNSPVAQNAGYGQMRQGRPGMRGKFVQVEPRMSTTGANADEGMPAKPGTEGVVALGLAHVVLQQKARAGDAGRAGALIEGWSSGLADFSPVQVEKITGVPAARLERIGRELVETVPAVAIVGGAPLAQTNGLFTALAVNALNALLGAVEQPGGVHFTKSAEPRAPNPEPRVPSPQPPAGPRAIVDALAPAKVLLLDG